MIPSTILAAAVMLGGPVPLGRPTVPVATAALAADSSAAPDQLIAKMRKAMATAQADPEAGRDALRSALAVFEAEPVTVASSEEAHAVRVRGLLALAAAELAMEREPQAIAAIDTAIRIARGEPLPVADFGAEVAKLHELRVAAPELRPAGSLHVTCTVQCQVILDGRTAGRGTDVMVTGIPLGQHQLRVQTLGADVDAHLQRDLLLSSSAAEQTFAFAPPQPTVTPPEDGARGAKASGEPPRRRLPRWAGIVGIAVGAALTVGGAVLIAVDGRCPDGSDPDGPDACDDVLNTDGVGIALTSIGAATLVGFSVALGIGESRDRKRKQARAALFRVRFRF